MRAVLLTGTVTAAAKILGRSQPAVSRMLVKLEEDLGVVLFERRRGLIVPTPEARLLLDDVERVCASVDSAKMCSSRLARGESGAIKVAVIPALGVRFMPMAIGRFLREERRTNIDLDIQLSDQVEELAAAQHIEFGLAEMPFKRSGFSVETFCSAPYLCAIPERHPLAGRERISLRDLKGQPLIYWRTPSRQLFDSAFQSGGISIGPVVQTTYSISVYELVRAEVGIGFVDPFTAALHRDEGVKVIPFDPEIPFNVAILRPKTKTPNPICLKMIEFIYDERDRLLSKLPS